MASVIHIKQLKSGKSHKTCLINHTWSISHHMTQLVISGLGDRQTDRQTDRHTHTHTHTHTHADVQTKETRRAPACNQRAPGLKIQL